MPGRRQKGTGYLQGRFYGLLQAWTVAVVALVGGPAQAVIREDELLSKAQSIQPKGMEYLSQTDFDVLTAGQITAKIGPAIQATRASLVGRQGGLQPPRTRDLSFYNIYRRCRGGVLLLVSPDGSSMGAGCVVDGDGHVLTNWHVVSGHEMMQAICYDSALSTPQKVIENTRLEDCLIAEVQAEDPRRDLALLHVKSASKLFPLKRAVEADVYVTQPVFAIGHPGTFLWTYTSGTISNLLDDYEWDYPTGEVFQADLILTETPTNPGSSGGPLFDHEGRMLGINTFKAPKGENINLAVRLHEIEDFLKGATEGRFPPATRQDTDPPSPPSTWDAFDVDSNGVIDTYFMDADGDGFYDVARKDENGDGVVEGYLADSNADRRFDLRVRDRDGNGDFEYWELDTDYDGAFETGGIDEDGDGEPDRYFDLKKE